MSSAAPAWWSSFFDDVYADFGLASADPSVNEQVVDFLMTRLALEPGKSVFDQCCGIGRLSLPLARRGVRVIGVDQSAAYITRARESAKSQRLPCEFSCADALEFSPPAPCDAAFNWFTSFGYHEDDAINVRMLQRVFDGLRSGGRFVIDYVNGPRVLAYFHPCMMQRHPKDDPDGLIVMQESRVNFLRGMIDSTWTFIHPDGRRGRRDTSTRLLMPHELVAMLEGCGFVETELLGWIDGTSFSTSSRRLIVLARKP